MDSASDNDPTQEDHYADLIKLFEERGNTPDEIRTIMGKVRMYDKETVHDSIMDSIADGRFSIDEFVRDALSEG